MAREIVEAMRARFKQGGALCLLTCLLTVEAHADDESATAEALFRAGREAMKQGDYPRACQRLRES